MQSITLSELETLAAGLAALAIGTMLCRRLVVLQKLDIPSPVIGGVLVALGVTVIRTYGDVEILFSSELSDFLLLMFFTTVGLSAKLSALKAGGKPLVILCGATVLMIIAQNIAGILVAVVNGSHPYYGLLAGSISLVGGPGTAAAWAKEAQSVGITHAPEVAVAAATLAVITGALVAGPITGWLVKSNGLRGTRKRAKKSAGVEQDEEQPAASAVDQSLRTVLLIVVAVMIGDHFNGWARAAGMVLPGFLTAMLGGVLITNVADLAGSKLDEGPIDRGGQIALSLKLWTMGGVFLPLAINVILQIGITTAIAIMVLFRMLGRDYDAALTVGGFIGFGLSSMAVGMATMDRLAEKYGPSPKAILLITLAGSFFVDLANALIVQLFLLVPIFG